MQRPQRIYLFQDIFPFDLCDLRIDLCGLCVKFLLLVAALPRRVIRGYVFPHYLNRGRSQGLERLVPWRLGVFAVKSLSAWQKICG